MSLSQYIPASVKRHKMKLEIPSLETTELLLAEKSLKHFSRQAWHIIEPGKPLIPNWHIDAICDHLGACLDGTIRNLIICIPPRFSKSTIVSVCFPAWMWIHWPEFRSVFASYAAPLAIRDGNKTRHLIKSQWYQERWGHIFKITQDKGEKFVNDKFGHRIATSVTGGITGEGGDCLVGDDLHNVLEAESDVKREEVHEWWDRSVPSRLDNQKKGFKILVMQRTHPYDIIGHIEKTSGVKYYKLIIPHEYDEEISKKIFSPLGFKDPRKEKGELLCPARIGHEEAQDLRKQLNIAYDAQYQQNPIPRTGYMFNVKKFEIIYSYDIKKVIRVVRYWDKAGTQKNYREDKACYTAGVKVALMADKSFIILDVVRGIWPAARREQVIYDVAVNDGRDVIVYVEQEPGSGGADSAEGTIKNLAGFIVYADSMSGQGSKISRAEPYARQVEIANVKLLHSKWNEEFIKEHREYPKGKKDQVDATTGALTKLALGKRGGTFGRRRKK